ncbi:MAG: toll/interleukin-1 receptor domain-containing protein [Actinomycetota bacterium]|nr:toll/interleukin-1 receptor domain-containing protein [Actinomycetota bacterium]
MPEPVSTTIFFSHSSKDAVWVEHLRQQALASGVEVYLAEHDVSPGVLLSDKVRAQIERSDAMLVLLTQNSWQSAYVQQEIGLALQAKKLVIPIVTPDAAHLDRGLLVGVEYILLEPEAPQEALAKLSASLTHFVRRRDEEAAHQASVERVATLEQAAAARRQTQLMIAGLVVVFGLVVLAGSPSA